MWVEDLVDFTGHALDSSLCIAFTTVWLCVDFLSRSFSAGFYPSFSSLQNIRRCGLEAICVQLLGEECVLA